jgi:flagellar hook-length control protein FliK
VVANQGSDSQQSPDRSGSNRAESAIVGSDADLQSDEVGKFESDGTRLVQGADTAQGLETRIAPASANPVATSTPAAMSIDSTPPAAVAEPKAPAATPLPISTQMSAHLSAFRGLADGTYETTIRLNPEELGQVSVRIQVNGGTVSIHAFGASDIAVQRLREAMPDLRQDLLQSGLDLVDSQVDPGAASFGNQREAASRRRLDSDRTEAASENRIGRPTDVDALTDVLRPERGRVDVRV